MLVADSDNPFASADHYTTLSITCNADTVAAIEAFYEEEALSVSSFEKEKGAYWQVDILLMGEHDANSITKPSGVIEVSIAPLEMQDWVLENQKNFPPIEVGAFYIHGSHLPAKPEPAISLQIDAGRAFGTGEHATTAGCLIAMQQLLTEGSEFKTIADIGCGTGILSLAAQRLWPKATVIASDMDAPSIDTAKENAAINHTQSIQFLTADGTQHEIIQRHAPYDLLIANILANPLIALAQSFAKVMHPNGNIILSGLLTRQEEEVLAAYAEHDWQLKEALHREEWSALILHHQ